MDKTLYWKAIDFFHKTRISREKIKDVRDKLPDSEAKEFKKLTRFLEELDHLLKTMKRINNDLIPSLETKLRIKFSTPELLMFALTRPSSRNIFADLKTFFSKNGDPPFNIDDFDDLASTGDAANVLALVGDAVLDLAVIEALWDSSLSTVGELTSKRMRIVSNQNLAKWCDSLGLYEFQLQRLQDPTKANAKDKTLEHEKGTLVEALLGVIYLENGYNGVLKAVPYLKLNKSDS
ncbi:MAG: ribonuclease III domain-containing protein [Candidatus Hodarchaeales archaeon]